jgi:aspartate 1-decarboxylase
MLLHVCKSKVHRATVTQTELNYEGSLTLDPALMEAAGIIGGERVQVLNVNNGTRLETYVIEGERGSGTVCLNGPAARLGQVGDTVIIIAYCLVTPEEARDHRPTVVNVDARNRARRRRGRAVQS